MTVYMRALYWEVYRLLPPSTTYQPAIRRCYPCCSCLRRDADARTDADRDSSKVPPAPNSHPKFPKTCVCSVRSVCNVRRGHAARGGQRFREVSQMPGRQTTLPKPAAALTALAAVRLTTLVGYGAGMAGKCGDVCGRMRLGESTRKRGLAPDGSWSSPTSHVPAVAPQLSRGADSLLTCV